MNKSNNFDKFIYYFIKLNLIAVVALFTLSYKFILKQLAGLPAEIQSLTIICLVLVFFSINSLAHLIMSKQKEITFKEYLKHITKIVLIVCFFSYVIDHITLYLISMKLCMENIRLAIDAIIFFFSSLSVWFFDSFTLEAPNGSYGISNILATNRSDDGVGESSKSAGKRPRIDERDSSSEKDLDHKDKKLKESATKPSTDPEAGTASDITKPRDSKDASSPSSSSTEYYDSEEDFEKRCDNLKSTGNTDQDRYNLLLTRQDFLKERMASPRYNYNSSASKIRYMSAQDELEDIEDELFELQEHLNEDEGFAEASDEASDEGFEE